MEIKEDCPKQLENDEVPNWKKYFAWISTTLVVAFFSYTMATSFPPQTKKKCNTQVFSYTTLDQTLDRFMKEYQPQKGNVFYFEPLPGNNIGVTYCRERK